MEKSDSSESIRAVVHPEKCYGCGVCVVNCPVEAITLKPARPPDYIPEFGPRY
jgi:NAD-dependent dihydropyrimidine dehydrogenase PreA subunit